MENSQDIMYESMLNMLSNDNYVTINVMVANKIGLNNTMFLSYLITQLNYWYKQKNIKEFYQPQEVIKDYTSLSPDQQSRCIRELTNYGLIEVTKKGIPAKNHYSIDILKVRDLFLNNRVTSASKTEEQENGLSSDININKEDINKLDRPISKDIEDSDTEPSSEEVKIGNRDDKKKNKGLLAKELFDLHINMFRDKYPELEKKLNQYLDYRLRVRGLPDKDEYKRQLDKLVILASKQIPVMGGEIQSKFIESTAIKIVEQSIVGGKQGLFKDFYALDDPSSLNDSFKDMELEDIPIGNINVTVTPPTEISKKEY